LKIFVLMLDDDDNDDYVGVSIFCIGGGVELPAGGDLLLSGRGRWLYWRRRCPLCSDAIVCVVVLYAVVVVRLFSSSRVTLLAFSLVTTVDLLARGRGNVVVGV